MADPVIVVHQRMLYDLKPSEWSALDFLVVLLNEDSTAVPLTADLLLAELDPPSNELVNDDYERQDMIGDDDFTGGDTTELLGSTVSFGALTAAHTGQAVKTVVLCEKVGDGTVDADQLLLASITYDPVVELNGGELTVAWPSSLITTIVQAV